MAVSATKAILRQGKTALFVCDLQAKFANTIHEFDNTVANSAKLMNCMRALDVPILLSEQKPESLGKTTSELDLSGVRGPFPKTQFSMYTDEVSRELPTLCSGGPPESILLIGIAAHICVEQTALDLMINGFQVHVVADCCSAGTQGDRILAFERMKQFGCMIATTENILFKLLGDAKDPKFKEVQPCLRSPTVFTGLTPLSEI